MQAQKRPEETLSLPLRLTPKDQPITEQKRTATETTCNKKQKQNPANLGEGGESDFRLPHY